MRTIEFYTWEFAKFWAKSGHGPLCCRLHDMVCQKHKTEVSFENTQHTMMTLLREAYPGERDQHERNWLFEIVESHARLFNRVDPYVILIPVYELRTNFAKTLLRRPNRLVSILV